MLVRAIYHGLVPSSWRKRVRRLCNPATKQREQWIRVAMYEDLDARLRSLGTAHLDAIEISGAEFGVHPWRRYKSLWYPEFDVCATDPPPSEIADVVIADQVLEHVVDPFAATRTRYEMCRHGGMCIVTTPFLYRVHAVPGDYWRFTRDGLQVLFERAGFVQVETASWGHRSAVGWRSVQS